MREFSLINRPSLKKCLHKPFKTVTLITLGKRTGTVLVQDAPKAHVATFLMKVRG